MRREVRANWSRTLLVCAKCSKKVGRAFGPDGDLTLAKALRRELGGGKGRKAAMGVAEVKCLGLCPKRAVVTLDAARPDRWLLVRPGEVTGEVVAALDGAYEHATLAPRTWPGGRCLGALPQKDPGSSPG